MGVTSTEMMGALAVYVGEGLDHGEIGGPGLGTTVPDHIKRRWPRVDNSDLSANLTRPWFHDLSANLTRPWFHDLSPDQKDACLKALLGACRDLADAPRTAGPEVPSWLPCVTASANSGAPHARDICREWSRLSDRYNGAQFERDFSNLEGSERVGIETLVAWAKKRGLDTRPWIAAAARNRTGDASVDTPPIRGSDFKATTPAVQTPTVVPTVTNIVPPASGSLATLPPIIDEDEAGPLLAEHLSFVHSWGGSSAIVTVEANGDLRRIALADLKQQLSNRWVLLKDGRRVPLVSWWMASPHRREFAVATYDPEGRTAGTPGGVLNLWRGLARQPRRGSWRRIARHLFKVICRSDRASFRYLVRWLAHAVQRPGTAPGTVLVLKSSREGTGKTTLGVIMHAIFGRHALMLNTSDQLVGRFNAHLEGVSFICLNEPSFPGDHSAAAKLRAMITDPTWLIEVKGRDIYSVPNIAHIMLTTNARWAVPAGDGARRFFVLDVSDARASDAEYFSLLYEEVDGGGTGAMLDFLRRLNLSRFDVRAVPKTAALLEQQILSAEPCVAWALELAEDPEVPWGTPIGTADLYERFTEHVSQRGMRGRMTFHAFKHWLSLLGLPSAQIGSSAARTRARVLPDAKDFRARVMKLAGIGEVG